MRDRLRQCPGPQRGHLTGPNPTDRGKKGSKIHLIVDRQGLPAVDRHLRRQPPRLAEVVIAGGPRRRRMARPSWCTAQAARAASLHGAQRAATRAPAAAARSWVGSGLARKSVCPAEVGHGELGPDACLGREAVPVRHAGGAGGLDRHCGRAVGALGARASTAVVRSAYVSAEPGQVNGVGRLTRAGAEGPRRARNAAVRILVPPLAGRPRYQASSICAHQAGELCPAWCGWPVIDGSTSRGCAVSMRGPWGLKRSGGRPLGRPWSRGPTTPLYSGLPERGSPGRVPLLSRSNE
ncbi:hypothetical protein STENM223S_03403 [Streptomyces tendae]